MLLYNDSTIDHLFYCVLARSKTRLFLYQQFLSLCLGSVEDYSEHDGAGMADSADGAIGLTLLEVAFLW